ncbi:hypothetical protein EPO44_16975 [bacterium]|nr:MAG: hypothetical protein EPO44_16975 [bacterium]
MSEQNEFQDFLAFLTRIKEKGEINPTTAQARQSACAAVLEMVGADEPHTARWVQDHLDDLMRRLMNKYPQRLTSRSAETYKSRVANSLSDYLAYREDPVGWRPKSARRVSTDNGRKSSKNSADGGSAQKQGSQSSAGTDFGSVSTYRYPLRPGLTLEIRNIPHDLKIEEVVRFAFFVATLAQDFKPGGSPFGEMVVRQGSGRD